MTPNTRKEFQQNFIRAEETSNTYKMRQAENNIIGNCDGIEAIIQAADKILSTERYQYSIYSWNYGIELADLIGMPISYCMVELERRIEEALLQDDRIKEVKDFTFKQLGKRSLEVKFTIVSTKGTTEMEKEMSV